jgi:hypothetical protein
MRKEPRTAQHELVDTGSPYGSPHVGREVSAGASRATKGLPSVRLIQVAYSLKLDDTGIPAAFSISENRCLNDAKYEQNTMDGWQVVEQLSIIMRLPSTIKQTFRPSPPRLDDLRGSPPADRHHRSNSAQF